jgi:HK97 family phage major capsid protein
MRESTRKAIEAEVKKAEAIISLAESEDRDFTAEERGKVTAHVEKAKEIQERSAAAAAALKGLTDLGDLIPPADGAGNPGARREDPPSGYRETKRETVGKAFVNSAEYKAMLASTPNGRFADQGRVQSQPFGVKTLITGLADDSAGSLISPDSVPLPAEPFNQRPMTIRQLFSQGQTGSDAIEYVQILSQTNNAAPVAEATSAGKVGDGTGGTVLPAAGGVKPESAFTMVKQSTTVKTIAHWIPATKRALSDAAQVRTLIDTFLRYGLEEEFEDQVISGNGTGENFLGLNGVSGVQTQAAPVGASGEDVFTVTRRARRKVRIGGRAIPTAFVMNPIDWENIELMRDTNKQFYGAGPFALTPPTLWALPVIESEAIAVGTAWCADWRMGMIWDREQATIQATDSHSDFFIRNLVAILAEMRAAFGVLKPPAFVKIALV